MAPTRSKKARKSTQSTVSTETKEVPESSQLPSKDMEMVLQTPTHTPTRRVEPLKISMSQKQALIDNLQLEVTERARKLRALYNSQAQSMRSRLEIRFARIPKAMRGKHVEELWHKYNTAAITAPRSPQGPPVPPKNSVKKVLVEESQPDPFTRQNPPPNARVAKRTSDEARLDKENEHVENPKKRVKAAPILPERTTSRLQNHHPAQVLSPRSANSRTLPISPIRPASPTKPFARPVSPVKPMASAPSHSAGNMISHMVEKAKSTRAGGNRKVPPHTNPAGAAGRGKRTAAAAGGPAQKVGKGRGSLSEQSDTSTGTTIVRKSGPVKKAPVKKTVMGTIKGMGASKKASTAKPASTASGGRVLRKRA